MKLFSDTIDPGEQTTMTQHGYTLKSLDNKVIGTIAVATLQGAFNGVWHWTQDTIAEQFHCHVDDVHAEENADGDLITAEGQPVAILFFQ